MTHRYSLSRNTRAVYRPFYPNEKQVIRQSERALKPRRKILFLYWKYQRGGTFNPDYITNIYREFPNLGEIRFEQGLLKWLHLVASLDQKIIPTTVSHLVWTNASVIDLPIQPVPFPQNSTTIKHLTCFIQEAKDIHHIHMQVLEWHNFIQIVQALGPQFGGQLQEIEIYWSIRYEYICFYKYLPDIIQTVVHDFLMTSSSQTNLQFYIENVHAGLKECVIRNRLCISEDTFKELMQTKNRTFHIGAKYCIESNLIQIDVVQSPTIANILLFLFGTVQCAFSELYLYLYNDILFDRYLLYVVIQYLMNEPPMSSLNETDSIDLLKT